MKKNRFLILIGLILLVLIVFVACNKTDSQTGDQNYSKYAGTYYEVVGDNGVIDSLMEQLNELPNYDLKGHDEKCKECKCHA